MTLTQAQQGPSHPQYPPQDDKEKYEQWKQQAAETVRPSFSPDLRALDRQHRSSTRPSVVST